MNHVHGEVSFRTRRAALRWRHEFAQEVCRQFGFIPALMIRRDLESRLFGRRKTVFTLEIPERYRDLSATFFPAPVINQ